jgi:hypothetical protein
LIEANRVWLCVHRVLAIVIVIIVIFDADSFLSIVWRVLIHYASWL